MFTYIELNYLYFEDKKNLKAILTRKEEIGSLFAVYVEANPF